MLLLLEIDNLFSALAARFGRAVSKKTRFGSKYGSLERLLQDSSGGLDGLRLFEKIEFAATIA